MKIGWKTGVVAMAVVVAGAMLYPQRRQGPTPVTMPGGASFLILLGVGDREPTRWDGSVEASGARVEWIHGWRFAQADSTDGKATWSVSTRDVTVRKKKSIGVAPNGVIVALDSESESARLSVKTARGNFSFDARTIAYGADTPFLDGKVHVSRMPSTAQLTRTPQEQDYPAMAQSKDTVYLSYVEFTHSDPELEARRSFTSAPKDFDFLSRPPGGDQVWLMRYAKSSRTWSPAMPVSAAKQDVMRSAVAVDGEGRVWVVWSSNRNGNFDLYARWMKDEKWSPEMRVTTNAGTDLNPVAATDAGGQVWIAWQGDRGGNLEVLAARQDGTSFGAEKIVSFSKANDWDPAIAAAPNGEVAVSWDTYDKGDYDVYFRRLHFQNGIAMDAPVAVAATPNFEARSSLAYDAAGRLWVAYEASDTKWGKDFGAYETTGVGLYQDHRVRVKCFDKAQALDTVDDLQASMPGKDAAAAIWFRNERQGGVVSTSLPDPRLAADPGNASPHPSPFPLNSFPRILADPNGAIYLTFRTPVGGQSPMGSVWTQNLVYLSSAGWKGPVAIPDTDSWLDGRAAMVSPSPGELLLIATADHRQTGERPRAVLRKNKKKQQQQAPSAGVAEEELSTADARINADLMAAAFHFGSAGQNPQLKPVPAVAVASISPEVTAERAQIAMMRSYHATAGGTSLQVMRGEFHRHTEMSGDGGRDGPLIDAYRYLLDAASMDWAGCCDHDNGGGREYSWWIQQKLTDAYHLGTSYVPMFAYERSVKFPEGHRNVVLAQRGIRPLPRRPITAASPMVHAPDTEMLYRYLKQFNGIVASHTSATGMGTDWRDNDPVLEPVVEIYQGDRQNYEMPGGPRSVTVREGHPGFVSNALKKGYRLGFQASSDHISTHMSYCNLWVTSRTREAILEAFHKRRIYGATDNILADVHCGAHFMGEEFGVSAPPVIAVKLWGTAPMAKVQIIKDGQYVYSTQPGKKEVNFNWTDTSAVKGTTSYYYVRGEQTDGELVWVSPMWIHYE